MAAFAELDANNIVVQIIVVDTGVVESDKRDGLDFLEKHYDKQKKWKRTRINKGGTTKNPAVIGATYDIARDAFIAPSPYPSFLFNETTCQWEAPTPKPISQTKLFYWNEPTLAWVEETRMAYTITDGVVKWL